MWAQGFCGLQSSQAPSSMKDLVSVISKRWDSLKLLDLCIENLKQGKLIPSELDLHGGSVATFKLAPEVVNTYYLKIDKDIKQKGVSNNSFSR